MLTSDRSDNDKVIFEGYESVRIKYCELFDAGYATFSRRIVLGKVIYQFPRGSKYVNEFKLTDKIQTPNSDETVVSNCSAVDPVCPVDSITYFGSPFRL